MSKQTTASISSADPNYINPGYIDVLYIPRSNDNGDNRQHQVNSEEESPSLLRTTKSCTPSYSSDRYDRERWFSVHDAERVHKTQSKSAVDGGCGEYLSRKRKWKESSTEKAHQNIHKSAWNAFQYYLERCIPVKFDDMSMFRDPSPVTSNHSFHGVLPCPIDSFPSVVLDKVVTAQCAFISGTHDHEHNIGASAQQMDRNISFCSKDNKVKCPTFMGQEDQITTEMTLREVVSWKISHSNSKEQQQVPFMAVCVAQEPILTISCGEKSKQICVQPDGRVGRKQQHYEGAVSKEQSSTEVLADIIRLPSYLLLVDKDEHNQNDGIIIHDINLWHAPQRCCSNVHYDDRDNILCVTEGVKTVELCPPGCIQASPIYSEHANHPATLSRKSNCQSIGEILELKQNRTHIVSISAGQVLYIPSGWWHRVESSDICTAVNVWFDYKVPDGATIPKHMRMFRSRQHERNYYESHEVEFATSYLEKLREEQFVAPDINPQMHSLSLNDADLNMLCRLVSESKQFNYQSAIAFSELFVKYWETCIRKAKSDSYNEPAVFVPYFANLMNEFLLRIRLDQSQQIQCLIQMWTKFTLPGDDQFKASSFTLLVQSLKPPACYVITQAWESHASRETSETANDSGKEEIEKSYQHFFSMFRDDCTKNSVRLFMLDSVDAFKEILCNRKL